MSFRTAAAATPTVVVTGGAGFLGNAFVVAFRRRFVADGVDGRVIALDRRPGPGITVGDVTDADDLVRHIAGADLIVHTAALVEESGPIETMWHVNVGGTRAVLEVAEAALVPVVHVSSVVVHG